MIYYRQADQNEKTYLSDIWQIFFTGTFT